MATLLEAYGQFRRTLARLSCAQLKNMDLGFNQMSIIYYLATGEASSATELAECMQSDRASLSRSIGSLLKANLITRSKSSTDRRREILTLTAKGKKKAKEAFAARDQIDEILTNALTREESRRLTELLRKASQII